MFRLALLLAALLCAAPQAQAAGRWVKSCNGTSCQRVWVEDRPAAKAPTAYCTCQNCNCASTGKPTAACSKPGSVFASCARYPAAKRSAVAGGSGWWLGKRLGRAKP
jgi:hypothetical protein